METNVTMMTKLNTFLSPTKIILGNGAVSQVGDEAKKLGGKKALIVTDKGVVKAGLISGVEESLKAQQIAFGIFDGVEAEPPARIVDECAQIIQEKGYDLVIGIGGGSSLDTAKGAAIVAVNGGKVLDYAGMDKVPRRGLPKILITTTAGTGSETTRVAVVTDEADKLKKAVYSDFNLAEVAIVDPKLMVSMPPVVTADTGMDALVHAIEAYVSVSATPFSDILAIEAIRLIAENLPAAYAKGDNLEARFNMALAATLAGMAFTSAGLGIVHAVSNPLGMTYHLTHGRSNAVMLPYVVDYNKIGSLSRYARIAQAMGENVAGLSNYEAAERLVSSLFRMLELLGIPSKLSTYGVTKEDIPKFTAGAMTMTRLFVWNPRNLTEEDIKAIYRQAL
ncbi:MAG TPA: iron-containing alcohol dehydrogenase [Dehalococcoidia bacterium]|jgi:alcohol dehydrogenase class IV|nr:iron-containing alcohol dehydrogenase [Dehalococcoidia bacterium]